MNIPEFVVLHHSYSPDNKITSNWEGMERYQITERGMSEIAYNGGIEEVNGVLVYKVGRSIGKVGEHALGFNSRSIGLVAIGNFDDNPVPDLVWKVMLKVSAAWCILLGIPPEKVIGHRETYKMRGVPVEKQCPGKSWDMNKFRAELPDRIALMKAALIMGS